MSIIGNAIAGGIGDGMRTYAGQMAAGQQAEEKRMAIAMELKAKRDALLTELAALKEKAEIDGQARVEAEKVKGAATVEAERIRRKSHFEERPDLYGANASPVDRARFEKEQSTFSRTDDSEYSDAVSRKTAPLVETKTKTFDEAGYNVAERERVMENRRGRVQVDMPQHADDFEKGAGRSIVTRELEKDPESTRAAAASMAVEGKPRFVQGASGNTVLDVAKGDVKVTDVGASVADKNRRPPAVGGGKTGSSTGTDANARALVASLRTQSTNASKNIAKLQEGYVTPQKQALIDEAKAQLKEINDRLRQAESALAKPGTSQGDNVAAPAGKAEYDKLPSGARYRAPDGTIRIKG